VSGGGAHLHINRTAYTKMSGVELHSNYFKALRNIYFQGQNFEICHFGDQR